MFVIFFFLIFKQPATNHHWQSEILANSQNILPGFYLRMNLAIKVVDDLPLSRKLTKMILDVIFCWFINTTNYIPLYFMIWFGCNDKETLKNNLSVIFWVYCNDMDSYWQITCRQIVANVSNFAIRVILEMWSNQKTNRLAGETFSADKSFFR